MKPIVVAGAAVAGAAAAHALLRRGRAVTVIERTSSARTEQLAGAGARIVISPDIPNDEAIKALGAADELVVSPIFAPHHPLVRAAEGLGLDIYSEPELAWRLRGPNAPAWLGITGTNGKTTTTTMLAAILTAANRRTAALGNIGEPLVDAGTDGSRYDVLAVELSSFQLYWSRDLAPQSGALLNLADDHLDWHGDFAAYAAAKTRIWRSAAGGGTAVGTQDDPRVAAALARVPGRRLGVHLAAPGPGQYGLVDGVLLEHTVDGDLNELIDAALIHPAGRHNISNALHAAALARSCGVPLRAVRDGLADYTPQHHRNAYVATVGGVDYVDDSKATNPHAALASLTAYPRVVWIAGGQLKGVDIDDLVRTVAGRLAGAVLLGIDRVRIGQALARHAPGLPVIDVASVDDGAMGEAVAAAASLARPGDTVLLAPAAASLDMYASYAQRGTAFADAVRRLPA